jgi:selenocysteine lyase/cysteine desulfurase
LHLESGRRHVIFANWMASGLALRFVEDFIRTNVLGAASNVSGILTDTDAITSLLHRYGFLAV